MTIIDVEPDTAIAAAATTNFDVQLTLAPATGGTVQHGTKVYIAIRADQPCELRIYRSFDNGVNFRNRNGVEYITTNTEFRQVIAAVGTDLRFAVKNIGTGAATVDFFSSIKVV